MDLVDLKDEYERLHREQRKLSRKQEGSNNYEKQREEVAKLKRYIRRKVLDYQRQITSWLVREYDAVFVEDLDVTEIGEQSHTGRNKRPRKQSGNASEDMTPMNPGGNIFSLSSCEPRKD